MCSPNKIQNEVRHVFVKRILIEQTQSVKTTQQKTNISQNGNTMIQTLNVNDVVVEFIGQ